MPGRRKEKRVKAVLPLKVSGKDAEGKQFIAAGHTFELSRSGVRLGGVPGSLLRVGETFAVQYRAGKAPYRIKWVESSGKDTLAGMEALQAGKDLWGVSLPPPEADNYAPPAKPVRRYEKRADERRRHPRFAVTGVGQIAGVRGGEGGRQAAVADVSREGCYIQTITPASPNTLLRLLIKVKDVEIEVVGVVRVAYPNAGMGIQFTQISASDQRSWYALIERLERGAAAGAG